MSEQPFDDEVVEVEADPGDFVDQVSDPEGSDE